MSHCTTYPHAVSPPAIVQQMGGWVDDTLRFSGDVVVHGVQLPQHVVQQLRQAGIQALSWMQGWELEEARQACLADGRLVDDHQGGSLRDKMTLTADETRERRRKSASPRGSFQERLERERKIRHSAHPDDEDDEHHHGHGLM